MQKLPEKIKHLGDFKLKDKEERNTVKVEVKKDSIIYIVKIPNTNNKFRLFVENKSEGKSNSN
jgi:hypothetical protein